MIKTEKNPLPRRSTQAPSVKTLSQRLSDFIKLSPLRRTQPTLKSDPTVLIRPNKFKLHDVPGDILRDMIYPSIDHKTQQSLRATSAQLRNTLRQSLPYIKKTPKEANFEAHNMIIESVTCTKNMNHCKLKLKQLEKGNTYIYVTLVFIQNHKTKADMVNIKITRGETEPLMTFNVYRQIIIRNNELIESPIYVYIRECLSNLNNLKKDSKLSKDARIKIGIKGSFEYPKNVWDINKMLLVFYPRENLL
jgi:hypothetical protein